jgi:hypothetical protein
LLLLLSQRLSPAESAASTLVASGPLLSAGSGLCHPILPLIAFLLDLMVLLFLLLHLKLLI